jgi:hypothetical protein
MTLATRLASLVARWRLRRRHIRRARQGVLDPGQQRHQRLLRDDRIAWLDPNAASPRQPSAAGLGVADGTRACDLSPDVEEVLALRGRGLDRRPGSIIIVSYLVFAAVLATL